MKKRIIIGIFAGITAVCAGIMKAKTKQKKDNNENYGKGNEGKFNYGTMNFGNQNLGSDNIGDQNLGNDNVGTKNNGSGNQGNDNIGYYNVGNKNIGCFNIGDKITGCFNNQLEADIYMFNKKVSKEEYDKFLNSDICNTLLEMPASNEKPVTVLEAFDDDDEFEDLYSTPLLRQIWYDCLSDEQKTEIKEIPNFDADVFESITGIKI